MHIPGMAKATATEVETVVKTPGVVLELTDEEASDLRSVLAQSTTSALARSRLVGINEALKAIGIEADPDCTLEVC